MEAKDLDNIFATGGEYELRYAIELYGYPILRYCYNILCDYYEAQDVVQITFIKAYNKREKFRNGTSLSAWLYSIAYTTCIDLLRKKKFLFFIPQTKLGEMHFTSEENSGLMSDNLKQALLTLSAANRALVFSRIIDEKSYKELEDIYHVSASTLRKRYERAKKKLSKKLREKNSYYKELEGIE